MLECEFIAVKITERIGIRQERNAATMQCRRLEYSVATALNQPKRSRLFRHDIIQKKHSIIQQGIKSPPEHCIPTVERLYQVLFISQFRQVGPEAASPASWTRRKHHEGIFVACNAPLRDLLFQSARCRRMLRVSFLTRLHSRL